jgi:hypothetical protein
VSHGLVELKRSGTTDGGAICFDAYCLDGDGWHMGRVLVDSCGKDARFDPVPSAIEIGLVPIPSIMSYVDVTGPSGIPRVLGWSGRGVEVRNMIQKVAYVLLENNKPRVTPV